MKNKKTKKLISLKCNPEPLEIDINRSALMIIDMQNAFVSAGGMFDLWGEDITTAQAIIPTIQKLAKAARTSGNKVIFTKACYAEDLHDTGGPDSPSWYRSKNLATFRIGCQ